MSQDDYYYWEEALEKVTEVVGYAQPVPEGCAIL